MKSYDVFDTLLTRKVLKPIDLFYLVGRKAKSLNLIANLDPSEFQKIRIMAENNARKVSKYDEVTIEEIYGELLKFLKIDQKTINLIKNLEIEYEIILSSKIERIAKRVDENSVLISDTYLSKDILEKLIYKNGIAFKDLFVSSEQKATKFSGELYNIVLKKYPINKHIGDNYISDYIIPKSLGLDAEHFRDSLPSRYEIAVYDKYSKVDYAVASIFSGCMRACRLSKYYDDNHLQKVHEIASNVIAPFLYLYVSWIMEESIKLGLEQVYFVSRDGEILHKIAQIIVKRRNLPIKISYLYGSRKAWHLPSVIEVNNEVLDWIFDRTAFLSINDICDRAGINLREFYKETSIKIPPNINLNEEQIKMIKDIFINNKNIHKLIITKANEKREILQEYLKQEGFSPNKKIGIVDIGWRGRQQYSLSKILDILGLYPKQGITSFYVALVNPFIPYKNDKYLTFFDSKKHKNIIGYFGVYESFVMAKHGSCIGYFKNKNTVIPILRKDINEDALKFGLYELQDSVIQFCNIIEEILIKENLNIKQKQEIAFNILNIFLKMPEYYEADTYSKLIIYEDQEERIGYRMVIPLTFSDLMKLILYRNKRLNHNIWKEGSISYSFPKCNKPFLKIYGYRQSILSIIKKIKNTLLTLSYKLFDTLYFKVRK